MLLIHMWPCRCMPPLFCLNESSRDLGRLMILAHYHEHSVHIHFAAGPAGGLTEPSVVPRFLAALEAAGAEAVRIPSYVSPKYTVTGGHNGR